MRDFGFNYIHGIDKSYREIPKSIETKEIREVAKSFSSNLDRTLAMCELPVALVYSTWKLMRSSPRSGGRSSAQATARGALSVLPKDTDPFQEVAEQLVDHATMSSPAQIESGFEAIFPAMLVATWSSFESLVGDLWVRCLNLRPRLGLVALDANVSPGDDEQIAYDKLRKSLNITVNLLKRWDYNLRNRMGEVLRDQWNFSSREKSRNAWYKVFGDSKTHLKKILDDKPLQWTNALRNAIVHNGGVADADFVRQVRQHPTFKRITEGSAILLGGSVVAPLFEATAKRGSELIEFADDWLKNNKE